MKIKHLILLLFTRALMAQTPTPTPDKTAILELKLAATQAQNTVLRLEALQAQYAELLRYKERQTSDVEAKWNAIYAAAKVKREDFDLDIERGAFVRKEQAKK